MSRKLSDILEDWEKTGDFCLIDEYRLRRKEVYLQAMAHIWMKEYLRSQGFVIIRTPTTADILEEDLQRTWKVGGKNGNV